MQVATPDNLLFQWHPTELRNCDCTDSSSEAERPAEYRRSGTRRTKRYLRMHLRVSS